MYLLLILSAGFRYCYLGELCPNVAHYSVIIEDANQTNSSWQDKITRTIVQSRPVITFTRWSVATVVNQNCCYPFRPSVNPSLYADISFVRLIWVFDSAFKRGFPPVWMKGDIETNPVIFWRCSFLSLSVQSHPDSKTLKVQHRRTWSEHNVEEYEWTCGLSE